ncbi:MAG: iron-sulfur cluster assembly scaffold protein [Candidatus Shapirobacteria bacterium]
MMNYSKIVLKHFRNPHNLGKIAKPDGVGEVGNMACGDVMRLYIKVKDDKIEDIKFETYGCAAAIATSSAVTDMAKGKTLDEVLKLDYEQVIKDLGGLPPIKVHCSLLAIDALGEAIYEYLVKNKREIPEDLEIKHQKILTRGRH